MSSPCSRATREARRKEAEERATERATRTPAQQLKELDARLGAGVGATRERIRLHAMTNGVIPTPSTAADSEQY